MRQRRPRVIRSGLAGAFEIALSIALSIELVYLLVANVILGAWLTSWFNSDEAERFLAYESAWSPWPGRVYARDLRLRVQDSNVQFELEVARAEVDVALGALLGRTFRATHLDADGVSFKFRHKLSEPPDNELLANALPRIEGFSDPPLMTPKPAEAPGKLWTVHITDVDARIDELWIQQLRSLGPARVWGGFRLEPTRRVQVDPAVLLLEPGPLYAGERRLVARDFGGRIEASVDDLDVQRLHGVQVFSGISTRIRLKATLDDLGFAEMFAAAGALRLANGGGPLDVDVKLIHGVLQPGSRASYFTPRAELYTADAKLFGDAGVELEVWEADRGRLSMFASTLAITSSGREKPAAPIVAARPHLVLETRTLDLTETWEISGGALELPEVIAENLSSLDALLPDGLRVAGGPVRGHARTRLDEQGALTGQLGLRFQNAEVRLNSVHVRATGSFESRLSAPDVLGSDGTLRDVALDIERGFLRTADGGTPLGDLRARAKTIPYSGFVPERFAVGISARFADAGPVLQTLGIEPSGIAAVAAGVLDLSNLELYARAQLDRGNVDVFLERARTDAVRARGRWLRQGGRERGAFLLMTDLVDIGLEVFDDDTKVRPLASEAWLEHALSKLDADPLTPASAPIGPRPRPARIFPERRR